MHHADLVCYRKLPIWTKDTLPASFTQQHNTKIGTWGKVTVISGELVAFYLDEAGNELKQTLVKANQSIWFEPQQWHRVQADGEDLQFFIEFYCVPSDYFHKKYQLSQPHSEVLAAMETVSGETALDLGCGRGRNSLFLSSRGFSVDAVDSNADAIDFLNEVIRKENINTIHAQTYDINSAAIDKKYDFIVSTVVLMFLNPARMPDIINNIQQATNQGGYNLIVAAMSTDDCPSPVPFPATFKVGELKQYYQDWEIIKYNEDFGHLHRTDEAGNPYRLRFATLLARKP